MYRKINDTQYQDLSSKAFIFPDSNGWVELQKWLSDGNMAAPKFTIGQLRSSVKEAVAAEGRRRIDSYGPQDSRAQRRSLARAIKLVRREAKGQLGDTTELDTLEGIGNKIEENEQIIESVSGYLDGLTDESDRNELKLYDPVNDPGWTI
jgi:hypothetical protein